MDEEANDSKVQYLHGKVCGKYGRHKRERVASYPGRSANPLAEGTCGILHRSNPDGDIRLSMQKSAEAIVILIRACRPCKGETRDGLTQRRRAEPLIKGRNYYETTQ